MPRDYFPLERLGFRFNPFRSLSLDEANRLAIIDDDLFGLLDQPLQILQVIGDKGAGKTTHLRKAEQYLTGEGKRCIYHRLEPKAAVPGLGDPPPECFLLDEAQRLGGRGRRFVAAALDAGVRLVLGSHDDLGKLWRSKGVSSRTVVLPAMTAPHLKRCINRRLHYAALGPARVVFADDAIEALVRTCDTDVRRAMDIAYEVVQDLIQPRTITQAEIIAAASQAEAPGRS